MFFECKSSDKINKEDFTTRKQIIYDEENSKIEPDFPDWDGFFTNEEANA